MATSSEREKGYQLSPFSISGRIEGASLWKEEQHLQKSKSRVISSGADSIQAAGRPSSTFAIGSRQVEWRYPVVVRCVNLGFVIKEKLNEFGLSFLCRAMQRR
jgi:hypothetical protein